MTLATPMSRVSSPGGSHRVGSPGHRSSRALSIAGQTVASQSSAKFSDKILKPKMNPQELATWRNAVKKDWRKLGQAPMQMRNDPLVVLGAMREGHWRAYQHASEELRGSRHFAVEAVSIGGLALQYGFERVRKDRDVVIAAARQNGLAIQHAYYSAHKDDKEIVLEAVAQDWRSLQFASDRLRGDREVVREALRQNWQTLSFVTEEIQADPEIISEAIRQDALALRYASEALRVNPALLAQARDGGLVLASNGDDVSYPYPDAWSREGAQVHSRHAAGGALSPPSMETEEGQRAAEAKGALQDEVDNYNETHPPGGEAVEATPPPPSR
eukprot:TRINITY_DN82123_c0_g1_i1.p1 TRINITY_DN82123_c0_g1~~TRINITY_DN82123_c0_g1_i1.p1  ORF type:complete len:329 (+),score=64.45 TRINITY_DN82123_c0_g1_i1:74-1060(+)